LTEELDLTPHAPAVTPQKERRQRSWRNITIVGGLVVVLGFVLFQAVTSARVFFYNVDEAIELQDELGDDNFRLQGIVAAENGIDSSGALLFDVTFNGETATIRHTGDEPTELFGLGEQVVADGHWEDGVFQSRQLLVKHTEEYIEDNPDRLDYELEPPADT